MELTERVFPFKTSFLKSFLMMKMVLLLLVASALHVQAADKKMSISKTNAPLKEIFNTIEKQSAYLFMYETGILTPEMKATVHVRNAEIATIMDECLKRTSLI